MAKDSGISLMVSNNRIVLKIFRNTLNTMKIKCQTQILEFLNNRSIPI